MAIAVLTGFSKAQVGEIVRFNASKSVVFPNESISKIEIQPGATYSFIDVTGEVDSYGKYNKENWFLDWAYEIDPVGEETPSTATEIATVKITLSDNTTTEGEFSIQIVDEEEDRLFCNDQDFIRNESNIFRYLPDGHNNFNYIHRESQTRILDELTNKNLIEWDDDRLTSLDIYEIEDVRSWSKYLGLSVLFYDLSDKMDDVFWKKAEKYEQMASDSRDKAIIRIGDSTDADFSAASMQSMREIRLTR